MNMRMKPGLEVPGFLMHYQPICGKRTARASKGKGYLVVNVGDIRYNLNAVENCKRNMKICAKKSKEVRK